MFSACSTSAKRPPGGGAANNIVIELKGKPGTVSNTRYFSQSRIKSYNEAQMTRDREESVDFTVQTQIQKYDPETKTLSFTIETVKKDGTVPLHDFAFPELREQIDYVVKSSGEVIKAGRFPPSSLFFSPSLPIPKKPVSIGDTWELDHVWLSAKDRIPMRLQTVGILKDIVTCEGSNTCAEIEVSGSVALVNRPTAENARFQSRMWGRVLFSLERGDIISSEMRSMEEMGVGVDRIRVLSCMISKLQTPKNEKSDLSCEPKETAVDRSPEI